MSNRLLTVSLSPHIHSGLTTPKLMYGVLIALAPALLVSLVVFGLNALILSLIAVGSCIFFEWAIQKYIMKVKPTVTDGSAAITGLLLAFNVPAGLPIWILLIGSFIAIAIAKLTYGGLGNNPFNPALVARVALLVSFPVQMTTWPLPTPGALLTDGKTGATILAVVKEGLSNGESYGEIAQSLPGYWSSSAGLIGGSIGEVSTLAILLGLAFMLYKKIITYHIPFSILATVFVFTGLLWLISPDKFADPLFHLTAGGLMLGAVFMATDYVTSPMSHKGMVIYGIGIGILTVVIRVWGSYPEGISFGILIMNAFTPLINKYVKPKRFGVK